MSITNYISQLKTTQLPSFMRSTLSMMAMLCLLRVLFVWTVSIIWWIKIDLPDWIVAIIWGTISSYYTRMESRSSLSPTNDNANTWTVQE